MKLEEIERRSSCNSLRTPNFIVLHHRADGSAIDILRRADTRVQGGTNLYLSRAEFTVFRWKREFSLQRLPVYIEVTM